VQFFLCRIVQEPFNASKEAGNDSPMTNLRVIFDEFLHWLLKLEGQPKSFLAGRDGSRSLASQE
jgi:hypothetical protein